MAIIQHGRHSLCKLCTILAKCLVQGQSGRGREGGMDGAGFFGWPDLLPERQSPTVGQEQRRGFKWVLSRRHLELSYLVQNGTKFSLVAWGEKDPSEGQCALKFCFWFFFFNCLSFLPHFWKLLPCSDNDLLGPQKKTVMAMWLMEETLQENQVSPDQLYNNVKDFAIKPEKNIMGQRTFSFPTYSSFSALKV